MVWRSEAQPPWPPLTRCCPYCCGRLEPWVLEVNSSPSLAKDSPVTTKLIPEMAEDMMKVVIDLGGGGGGDIGGVGGVDGCTGVRADLDLGGFELLRDPRAMTPGSVAGC